MLPIEVVSRFLDERQILGLLMKVDGIRRIIYFETEVVEGPDDLMDFSLGAAVAQATAGTGWKTIQDSSSRYYLEPADDAVIYHFFYGISPGQARVYLQYPSGVDLNSLITTRAISDPVGFVDGIKSPYRSPSVVTEMFSMNGAYPAFLGYNPYKEPASITIRMNFFIMRYSVRLLGTDGGNWKIAPPDVRARAAIRAVGGRNLVDVPSWIQTGLRR